MTVLETFVTAAGITAAVYMAVVSIFAAYTDLDLFVEWRDGWVNFVAKLGASERASTAIGLLPFLVAFTASITSLLYQSGVL